MTLAVKVPEGLAARVPAEQRGPGLGRDAVRLLVSRGTAVSHHAFAELPALLRAGDLLIVNTSQTLPAAVDGTLGHARVVVHFSTRGDDGRWAVELRDPENWGTTRARAGGPAYSYVQLPGDVHLICEEPLAAGSGRLWWARVSGDVPTLLHRHGRPIRYSYTERDQPLSAYQTVFAVPSADGSGSAEMPSAARPFTEHLVARLVSRGVQFAPVTLHTGVASPEAHEPPYPERFAVPQASARLINAARAAWGPRHRGRHDGGAGRRVGDGTRRGGQGRRGAHGARGDTGARRTRGGRPAHRAARARGLASADAGGGRRPGRRSGDIPRRYAVSTSGTSSATSTSSSGRTALTLRVAPATVGKTVTRPM